MKQNKKAIIIGAGPAGLSAAYELLQKTDIIPYIYEKCGDIGGISKTIDYKGYKIDFGPHRFFSKSEKVLDLWEKILPLQGAFTKDDLLFNRNIPLSNKKNAPDPEKTDRVMLYKNRLTRIFFLRKFFDYPVSLSMKTVFNLGLIRLIKIMFTFFWIRIFPRKNEKSLEDFFINRFGKELYSTFFEDYTQKVWGVPCSQIPADWGAQRVKGLSITKVILDALKKLFRKKDKSMTQKGTETSLIERFYYPKKGAGHLYNELAEIIKSKGGKILLNSEVVGLNSNNNQLTEIIVKDMNSGKAFKQKGDYFFSSMPVKELINSFTTSIPENVKEIANNLVYRDYLIVGLLLNKMVLKNKTRMDPINNIIQDNWIYIQEKDVKIGRLDIFNNFSLYMLKDLDKIWVGAEYFCNEGDELWIKNNDEMKKFAIEELEKIGIITREDVLDGIVLKMPKAYPAYFGSYKNFNEIIKFTDSFENLFLIGRNGMHKYNNMDHSILSGMIAAENVANNIKTKDNLWALNTEKEYHESKK